MINAKDYCIPETNVSLAQNNECRRRTFRVGLGINVIAEVVLLANMKLKISDIP